jgi:predicted DNA-binding protein YlxM (UPF0122 family)
MNEITSFSTMILHDKRINLGLSCNEYCVADLIDHYSDDGSWCELSRQEIADMMGISKQTIIKILSSLLKQELIIINTQKKITSSERWKKIFDSPEEKNEERIYEVEKVSTFMSPWRPAIAFKPFQS